VLFLGNVIQDRDGRMGKERAIDSFTDDQLLDGIRNADHNVFTALYSRHFQGLSLASMKYVKDSAVAEEIVQDVFLKLWEDPGHILNAVSLKAYLYRSVINHSINYINRQKNIAQHHLRMADEISHAYIETMIEDHALKELLYREIEQLPEQCRKVFKMSRFQDMKYREIAAALGIAEKTVENHIVNALRTLRANILTKTPELRTSDWNMDMLMTLLF
jgi:RNA polymerase sigma-70 factor (ECF subfamily)